MDCLFCKITAGEIPANKIYEDEIVLAFLDIRPVSVGHTLVIPKTHSCDMNDTAPEILARVAQTIPKIAAAIVQAVNTSAYNIGVNNGAAAGQLIFHSHWHIIPRFPDDGLRSWPHQESESVVQTALAERIRSLL